MRTLLWTLIIAACLAATAFSQGPPAGDYLLTVVAKTADGRTIAHSGFDYYPEEILPEAFKAGMGWNWCCSGEPLNLKLGGWLSNDDYDPLNPGSCGPGVDPAAIAAFQSNMVLLRYGFTEYRCPDPAHPSGRFYAATLPGNGTVILRLPAGEAEPAEAYAEYRGERYPLGSMPVEAAVELMLDGDPHPEEPEGSLETQVARADCKTIANQAAEGFYEREARLIEAASVVNRCIRKYHERHGMYPEDLSDLTTVPGAVVARLPLNPYNGFELEKEEVLLLEHGIDYIPEYTESPDGERTVTGYWLVGFGTSGEAAPEKPLPYEGNWELTRRKPIKWYEQH